MTFGAFPRAVILSEVKNLAFCHRLAVVVAVVKSRIKNLKSEIPFTECP